MFASGLPKELSFQVTDNLFMPFAKALIMICSTPLVAISG